MSYEHKSGLLGAYDRAGKFPLWDSVITREGHVGQAAEIVEAQTIMQRKVRAIGDLTARDGDRQSGCDVMVDQETGIIKLTSGTVYVSGRVLPVDAATFGTVPMTGAISIGVRLVESFITEQDEPALLGLHPGTPAKSEKGAARGIVTLTWGYAGDGKAGDLYSVYLLMDGVIIDQSPPPSLTGINAQLAVYDFDANGHYVVNGCRVSALGKTAGKQVFSIEEGVANINGFKRSRTTAIRHAEIETSDIFRIPTEIHTFTTNPTKVILNHGPIATVREVMLEKEVTESVTRGASGGDDGLVNTGVTSITSITQGGTTYTVGTDFNKNGDRISWSPPGNEPAIGSTYSVKYRFLGIATPTDITHNSLTVAGGVVGGQIQIDYDFRLPRVDIIGLSDSGLPVYIKGISSRSNPLPPMCPKNVLPLALAENNWISEPAIIDIAVPAFTMEKIGRIYNSLINALDLAALERLQRDIDSREPIAKNCVFVDPFQSDRYRDQGAPQTAAVFGGLVRLAIDPSFHSINLPAVTLLDWTEEVVVEQALATSCTLINPYQNFNALPASMTINPPVDYWQESATEWASDSAKQLSTPVVVSTSNSNSGRTTTTTTTTQTQTVENAGQRSEALAFLRPINLTYNIEGFFAGENLKTLTFDSLDIKPQSPVQADAAGKITGTFKIPEKIPAGAKELFAEGQGGSFATAAFVGQGTIDITTLRRVTTTTVRSSSVTSQEPSSGGGTSGGGERGGGADPIAQTFTLINGRHIAGLNIQICAIGNRNNPIVVEIVEVENGYPTTSVIAQAYYSMLQAVVGQWTEVRFDYPIWLDGSVEYAFVVKTNDAEHAIHTAKLGDFDITNQTPVAAQPYSVGVMFTSSNAVTWSAHQDEDVCFQLIGAKFVSNVKTVPVGSFAVTSMSDLLIRAEVELPTFHASFLFEVELDDGSITLLAPGQAWELQSYYTGTVKVRARLTGSETVSPVVFPVILAISGKVRSEGTYITRAFDMGTNIKILSYLKTRVPTGSTIKMHVDAADNNWMPVEQISQSLLSEPGWLERKYSRQSHNANPVGRVRITLEGTPAARPMGYDFRAISAP